MADIGEFIGTLKINFERQGIKDAAGAMSDAQKQGSLLDDISNRLVFTMGDLYQAGAKIVQFMWSFVSTAAEAELAEKKLSDAMKVQQIYSEDSYNANLKYAESMQTLTKYDKEEILTVMQKLTTFGLHDEQLRKTTTATMDLAARGYDLNSISMILGKAFEGNTTALKRFGITIDGNIPSSQKFDAVLGYIQQHMGGLARGEAETLTGKLAIMNNQIKEMKESIGNLLLPVLSYWADKLSSIAKFVNELRGAETQEAVVSASSAKEKFALMEKERAELQRKLNELKQYAAEGSFVNQAEVRQIQEKIALIDKASAFVKQKAVEELNVWKDTTNKKKVLSLAEQQIAEETARKEIEAASKRNIRIIEIDAERYHWSITQEMDMLKDFQSKCEIKSTAYEEYQKKIDELDKKRYQSITRLENQLEGDFAGGIRTMLDGSRNFSEAVGDIWKNITNQILDYIAQIIAKWLILNAITGGGYGIMHSVKSVLGFDEGGTVPGPIGMPRLVIAHGGETIVPTHKSSFSSSSANNNEVTNIGDTNITIAGNVDKTNIDRVCQDITSAVKKSSIEAIRMAKALNKRGTFKNGEAF